MNESIFTLLIGAIVLMASAFVVNVFRRGGDHSAQLCQLSDDAVASVGRGGTPARGATRVSVSGRRARKPPGTVTSTKLGRAVAAVLVVGIYYVQVEGDGTIGGLGRIGDGLTALPQVWRAQPHGLYRIVPNRSR